MKGFEDTPVNWAPVSVWHDDQGTTHQTVEFIVPGIAVSQGNITQGRYGNLYDRTKGLKDWRHMVTMQARNAIALARKNRVAVTPFNDSVGLHICFVLRRPTSSPKYKFVPAVKKPDLDKLARAISDSLTDAGLWGDDSQVVELFATKRLADHGESPGVYILVTSNVGAIGRTA